MREIRFSVVVLIGISGWTYRPWRGVFYPKEIIQRKELYFASREFRSIEINGTFYSLQRPSSFLRWYEETPKDFVFSVKGSRYITHLKRLKDVEKPVANFFASGVLALREKLGPFLWQFPPSFHYRRDRLEDFFAMLPRTVSEAVRLAQRSELVKDRTWLKTSSQRPLRHCVEVRHESFMNSEFFTLLRRYGVAFVFADTAGKWPYAEDLTSDFAYIRLHGDKQLYASGYTQSGLEHWARRILRWAKGGQIQKARLITARRNAARQTRDVFVYFDNDLKVRAPADAKSLRNMLRV